MLSTEEQRRYEYFFLEAVRLEQQERFDEAFEMIQHCLSIAPEAPSALYKAANYYFFLNRKEMALEALTKAVEGEPDNYWYKQTLASYYQSNREYDKAIAVLEEMQRQFPKRNGELLTALVGLYSHTQQYGKVVDALERLEQLMGKSEAISMEKSRNYLLMGNKEEAFGELEALAAEYPENSYYRVILSNMYMEHERMSDALPLLQEVLAEEPDNGPAKITLTQYYKQLGDTVQYRAMVDSVMMTPTVDDDTKVKMMVQLVREKTDSTYVMELFDRVMQQPQRTAKVGHLCVQYMLKMNQPEERVRPVLLRMLEVEPDHIQARLQLLSYAARRNDMEEVISVCSTAIDYCPEVLDFYYYKAIGLYQTDKLQEALLYCYRAGQPRQDLTILTARGMRKLSADDIVYIETWGRGVRFHLQNGQEEGMMKISELESVLPADRFVLCHRTILVNLAHVRYLRYCELELKSGAILPVSKYRQNATRDKLMNYLQG